MKLNVLFEDNHLLVVAKPAGLATMGATPGSQSLHQIACQYLKKKYGKPGRVYLGVVMRLDACASGVVVFARTSKAAARLTEQFRERLVEKTYWAVIERTLDPHQGELADWIAKDDARHCMIVAPPTMPGGQQAALLFETLQELSRGTLVAITLITGRKHQIRVQFAARGAPILGDSKYGAVKKFDGKGIALHAVHLTIQHPVQRTTMTFRAKLPESWSGLGIDARFITETD